MVRDMRPEDAARLQEIHSAQGFDYALPDFNSPLFLVKKVREKDGKVTGALALRITAETFLLVDGSDTEKGRSIEELQPEVLREAWEKGLEDVVCVVPPEIEQTFAPALERLGWAKDRDWTMFSRRTHA